MTNSARVNSLWNLTLTGRMHPWCSCLGMQGLCALYMRQNQRNGNRIIWISIWTRKGQNSIMKFSCLRKRFFRLFFIFWAKGIFSETRKDCCQWQKADDVRKIAKMSLNPNHRNIPWNTMVSGQKRIFVSRIIIVNQYSFWLVFHTAFVCPQGIKSKVKTAFSYWFKQ